VIGRLLLLTFVAVGLAPGTWVRTPVVLGDEAPVLLRVVDEPGKDPPAGWTISGVWEFSGDGRLFGGYSALLALDGARLQAFSDRGGRFTFLQPDQPQGPNSTSQRTVAEQDLDSIYQMILFDIESATRDPVTGQYWLGYESIHSLQRFSAQDKSDGVRIIHGDVEWPSNSGAEAMVRLQDGQFLVIPERGGDVLFYPGDPISGGEAQVVTYEAPDGDFSVTDAVQLPDGRLLLLLRKVAWGLPPFEARIALAKWPNAGGKEGEPVLAPQIALDLSAVAPPENYEGVAVRERDDGTLDIWVIADDNLAVMQRTLVVKLGLDPTASKEDVSQSPQPKDEKRKKARE